jgi:hypothetical protein
MACARKAHKVEDDGGAEGVLGSASGSLPNYHGHPPGATGRLGSLVPDLVLGPGKALDSGELQQPGRRGKPYDQLLRHEVEGADGLGLSASAIKPGRQSLNRTSMDGRRSPTR